MSSVQSLAENSKFIRFAGNSLMFLLLLVVMLDPTNTVLHIKDLVFIALVGYNAVFYKANYRYLPFILLPYIMLVCSYLSAQCLGSPIDYQFFFGMAKGFAMLVLLLWVDQYDILKMAKVSGLILAIVATILFFAVMSSEVIEGFTYDYMQKHNEMVLMSRRSFLGFHFYGMYYRSIISVILPFYLYCYSLFVERKHVVWNTLCVVIITIAFATSGTRSTMLLPLTIIGLAFFQSVWSSRYLKLFMLPLLLIASFAFLFLVYKLASEKGEISNYVKYGHLTSYMRQFEHFPEYYIWGQGVGSWIYSIGFKESVTQTEWTYIELLRTCGLFSLLTFALLLYPIKKMKDMLQSDVTKGILLAYVMFILIAGTNPLLISSTGMVVLLMAFSYIAKAKREHTDKLIGETSHLPL